VLGTEVAVIDNKTNTIVAPIIINNISKKEIAKTAKTIPEFRYNNQVVIVERAIASIQITNAIGFLRWTVSEFAIKINNPVIYIIIIKFFFFYLVKQALKWGITRLRKKILGF